MANVMKILCFLVLSACTFFPPVNSPPPVSTLPPIITPPPIINPPPQIINNFDDCARAGYPIMESYPRQCRTPDGRTFVEEAVTQICRYQQECGKGFFCRFGTCTEFAPDFSCRVDDDCVLINEDWGYACCWIGRCAEIDYSQDYWVAVNGAWFSEGQGKYCPTKAECGPAPMCPTRLVNDDFAPKCVNGACRKMPS